ncbi:uncharacterized protein LOC119547812 [Drosophila subpulchrella]|uniref:uncharacterized protein LOC119547812 n=1 Tax=Drosophila subpulchrella TaxID=1486046 RepID=UPI0018A152FC|nr:uncharacterized protein LOC119547812 [Drosophila subpulchrella]XP_037710762.1 uncharacterized protein LOC119547812 [Drosophila subpulchrella]
MPTTTIPNHHMQMANKWRAKKDCGFQGYGSFSGRGCVCWISLVLLLILVPDFIVALKDVSVMIPQAVKRGSNALFTCNYDMENDTLYSVKWYKGKREFYRYTPKENPAMKVFAMTSGLNVERNLSNQSHVVLQSVPLNISGKFTCEISVEAPTFQTAMVSGEMEVVELPEEHTVVTGIQARYRIGDLVDGNCSIKYSKPAANLTWTINGIVVPPHHIKTYQTERRENSTLESVTSAIHFMVTNQHFLKSQMRLKCTANIFDIFKEEMESVIEEDRPRIMASGRSYDINNYPLEEHTNGERGGFEDHNESYLTYYSADNAASGASTAAQEIFWQFWPLKLAKPPINRQLAGAWHWICGGGGAAALLLMPLLLGPLTHQIINCQYTKPATGKVQQQQQQQQQHRSSNIDVTASKAATSASSVKCFYNCQMATAMPTQSRDGDDDGDANIGSTTATATATADVADVAAVAGGVAAGATASASCSIKRLSATLVGGGEGVRGVASWPDQRLLMTRRREKRQKCQKKSQAMDAMMQSRCSAC